MNKLRSAFWIGNTVFLLLLVGVFAVGFFGNGIASGILFLGGLIVIPIFWIAFLIAMTVVKKRSSGLPEAQADHKLGNHLLAAFLVTLLVVVVIILFI